MKRDSYYDQPAIKPSPYGFLVALYTVVGGLAGAAQVLGILAQSAGARGARTISRNARLIAAAGGTAIGPALLVLDLHTPRRWYNMLRIFRRTSPMSIGTYVLSTFGASSAAALTPARPLARVPALVSGAAMTTYTAPLLSATATPLWAASPRPLAAQFAASGFASAAAALSIAERCAGSGATQGLDRIAAVASATNLAAGMAANAERRRRRVPGPRGRWGVVYKAGLALGTVLPLACYAADAVRGAAPRRSALAAGSILAGTLLSRWALFKAGNASAERPSEYLRFASHDR